MKFWFFKKKPEVVVHDDGPFAYGRALDALEGEVFKLAGTQRQIEPDDSAAQSTPSFREQGRFVGDADQNNTDPIRDCSTADGDWANGYRSC